MKGIAIKNFFQIRIDGIKVLSKLIHPPQFNATITSKEFMDYGLLPLLLLEGY